MPRRVDILEQESKYPEEQSRLFDKDDRKQQEQTTKLATKQNNVDMVAKLKGDFEKTDYSLDTNAAKRLEHMNADINKIVVERDRIAKEKEAQWEIDQAEKDTRIRSGDKMRDAPENKKVTQTKGIERDVRATSEDLRVARTDRTDSIGLTGNMPSSSFGVHVDVRKNSATRGTDVDQREISTIRGTDNLTIRGTGSDAEYPGKAQWKSKTDIRARDLEGDHTLTTDGSDSGISSAPNLQMMLTNKPVEVKKNPQELSTGVQILGRGHNDLNREKWSLDHQKELRRRQWEGYQPLHQDPDNHPAESEHLMPLNLTDTLPHGSVERKKQTSSSAPNPVAYMMEDSDSSRINPSLHNNMDKSRARSTQDRSARLHESHPISDSLHATRDFLSSSVEWLKPADVPAESEKAFDTDRPLERDMLKTLKSQQDAEHGRSWTEGTSSTHRVVLPTYLPPESRAPRTGVLTSIKTKLHDTKESVEETLEGAKEKIEDKVEATKEVVEEKLESAKETIEDTLESAKEKIGHGLHTAKDTVVGWKEDVQEKLVDMKHTIVDKTDEFTTKLQQKTEEVKDDIKIAENRVERKGREWKADIDDAGARARLKGIELKEDAQLKGREWKADIDDAGARARLKGVELKQDAQQKTREWKADVDDATTRAKLKGREWKDGVEERSRELKHDADSKVREWKSDIREEGRELKSEAKGVIERISESWWNPLSHLTHKGEIKERHLAVDSSPEGIHLKPESTITESDRHIKGATIRLPSIAIEPVVPVPNSLRGLESDAPARNELHGHGVLYKFMHMFDSNKSASRRELDVDSRSELGLSREDKLNASARDFWDLRAQGGEQRPSSPIHLHRERSASPSAASVMLQTMKGDESSFAAPLSPRAQIGGYSRGSIFERDILHDQVFEELMAETME